MYYTAGMRRVVRIPALKWIEVTMRYAIRSAIIVGAGALAIVMIELYSWYQPAGLTTVPAGMERVSSIEKTSTDSAAAQSISIRPLSHANPSTSLDTAALEFKSTGTPIESDLRAVLKRVEQLERSLDKQESSESVKSSERLGKLPPIVMRDDAQELADAQKRVQQRVAMMSNRLLADRASSRAGDLAATEREVKLATEDNSSSTVERVDCGESLCRMRVTVKDEAAIGGFMVGMIDKLQSWGGGAESHIVGHLPNGSVEIEVFVGRQGHALPQPNADGI